MDSSFPIPRITSSSQAATTVGIALRHDLSDLHLVRFAGIVVVWLAILIASSARAEVLPWLPPTACCPPMKSCPSVVASRIPLPEIQLAEQNLASDPSSAPHWTLSLHEAVRVALGNSEAVRNLGLIDAGSDIDIIRSFITVYDPLVARAAADAEWGIFDPVFTSSTQWTRQDLPPGTSFAGIGNRPPLLDLADHLTTLEQLFPSGGTASIGYATDYLFNPQRPASLDPNPQYFSYTQFGVSQPVGRGYGVDVTMAPIRIAAARAEMTDWRFKQEVLALVRSVETSYWTLYLEQQNFIAIDQALPLLREIVRVRQEQASTDAGTNLALSRARAEMLMFEQRRLATLSRIAEQQLVIRDLMGLAPNDDRYLALVALPTALRPIETVQESIVTAINRRPDVLRQRLAVYVAQQERLLARDQLKPIVNLNAFWRINGLADDLGGSLNGIGDNDHHDWNLGFTFQVPLGRRKAKADLRAADFLIQKERTMLNQVAHQTSFEVADAYRRIEWLHQQNLVAQQRVEALQLWQEGSKAQLDNPPPGMSKQFALELYLQNMRDMIDATISSNAILADYNSAFARLEEVKGTLLESRLVEISGDATDTVPDNLPLPEFMQP